VSPHLHSHAIASYWLAPGSDQSRLHFPLPPCQGHRGASTLSHIVVFDTNMAMGWTAEGSGFNSPQCQEIILHSTAFIQAQGSHPASYPLGGTRVGTVYLVQYIFEYSTVDINALCSSCEDTACCSSVHIIPPIATLGPSSTGNNPFTCRGHSEGINAQR
jgi:hypothetical protein